MKKHIVNRVSLRRRQLLLTVLALLAASGCAQGDNGNDDEKSMETPPDKSTVSREVELSADSTALDAEALLDDTYQSPMKELESVDDVVLSDEAQREAEQVADESDHAVKQPSKPDK